MVENERTMCRINDDGTITVAIIRTIEAPAGPVAKDRTLESDTLDLLRRHAAAFMFPFAKRKRMTDRNE